MPNSNASIVVSTKSAPHFIWGDICDGWWLKKTGNFTVVSEAMPAHSSEIKHFHNQTEQFFHVLEEELIIELNNTIHCLKQNEGLTVTPRTIHKVYNNSNYDMKFLVISCPDSHEDRVNGEN